MKVSALNERSVVIGTLSSPTFTPFTVSENQLSAHTCAVNVTDSATEEVSAVCALAVVDDEVAAAAVEVVSDDDDTPHPMSSIDKATVATMVVLLIIKALSQPLERIGGNSFVRAADQLTWRAPR